MTDTGGQTDSVSHVSRQDTRRVNNWSQGVSVDLHAAAQHWEIVALCHVFNTNRSITALHGLYSGVHSKGCERTPREISSCVFFFFLLCLTEACFLANE